MTRYCAARAITLSQSNSRNTKRYIGRALSGSVSV